MKEFLIFFKTWKAVKKGNKDEDKCKLLKKIINAEKLRAQKRFEAGKPIGKSFREYDQLLAGVTADDYKLLGKLDSKIPWISESQANAVLASKNAVPQQPGLEGMSRINGETWELKKWINKSLTTGINLCPKKRAKQDENPKEEDYDFAKLLDNKFFQETFERKLGQLRETQRQAEVTNF